MGYGVSPTGFLIAGSRIYQDNSLFKHLYATAACFGVPRDKESGFKFVTGGFIGNAIMFAMLTANNIERFQ